MLVNHCLEKPKNTCLSLLFYSSIVTCILKFSCYFLWDNNVLKKIIGKSKIIPQGGLLFNSNIESLYFPIFRVNILGG